MSGNSRTNFFSREKYIIFHIFGGGGGGNNNIIIVVVVAAVVVVLVIIIIWDKFKFHVWVIEG